MSIKFYPNGIGGTVGDSLDTCKPLMTSGNVWYVSSLTGTDASGLAGLNREAPLATLAQAVTNSSNDDIIVFLAGHTQTLTAFQSLSKRLVLIGEGTTAGKPAVSFLMNAAGTSMFSVSSSDVELRNLYFPPNVQTNGSVRINAISANFRAKGCYFECGATDTNAAIALGSTGARIENCTFISVGTTIAAQPNSAIKSIAASTLTNLEITDTVVSAGTVGFSNFAAVDLSNVTAATQIKVEGLSLLLGADMDLGISSTATGRVNVQLATGGSRVNWS